MSDPSIPDLLKVAVVQHAPVFLNLEQSLDRACVLIEQAADQGARVVVFPVLGYPVIRYGWIYRPRPRCGITYLLRHCTGCWWRILSLCPASIWIN